MNEEKMKENRRKKTRIFFLYFVFSIPFLVWRMKINSPKATTNNKRKNIKTLSPHQGLKAFTKMTSAEEREAERALAGKVKTKTVTPSRFKIMNPLLNNQFVYIVSFYGIFLQNFTSKQQDKKFFTEFEF